MSIFFPLLSLLISLFLFLFAPEGHNYVFCWVCALVYLSVCSTAFRLDISEKRYVSFNIVFFIFLFISSFILPLFLQSTSSYLDRYINRGTALVTFAACAYNWGWQRSIMRRSYNYDTATVSSIPRMTQVIMSVICIIIFIVYVVLLASFMRTLENQTNDFDVVFFVLILNAILTSTLLINVLSKRQRCYSVISFIKENVLVVLLFFFVVFTFLSFGDRTTPIYLGLVVVGTYELFVHRIKLPTVILVSIVTLVLFFTVGQTRIATREEAGKSSLIELTQTTLSNTSSIIDVFSDFVPASSALYLSLDYIETNHRFYYPEKIIITVLSPIPFVPSLLSEALFHIPNRELSSSYLTTSQYDRNIKRLNGGLGTHCVGDIYLSWGLVGVFLAFFLLGRIMGIAHIRSRFSIYWAVVYISMLGNAVYIPRATLFDSYRLIVFQLFIIWLLRGLHD